MSTKYKIILLIASLGLGLIYIFKTGLYSKEDILPSSQPRQEQTENLEPEVVSTNPNPLEEAVILPTQIVEITFNQPLENRGEFKNRLEPKISYEIKLSDDRKTAKVTPHQGFDLGTTYTLFILPDSKFDGKKLLGKELIYHFKTVKYKGI